MWNFLRRCLYKIFFRDEQKKQVDYINSLFEDLLGRSPDAAENDYWVNRIRRYSSPAKVFFEIRNSDEFKNLKLIVNNDEQKKDEFIDSLFNDLLELEPDSKRPNTRMDRFARFSSAVDNYLQFVENFKVHKKLTHVDDSKKVSFVNSLFNDLLRREVDVGDLEYWVNRFEDTSPVDIYFYFINLEAFKRLNEVKLFVPPGHFYSPIVDPKQVMDCVGSIFDRDRELPGIDLREQDQTLYLGRLKKHFGRIPWSEKRQPGLRYYYDNPAFCHLDAIILGCTIIEHQPKTIVEIGSGYSSAAMLDIIERELPGKTRCCFIEPYPEVLRSLCKPEDLSNIEIYSEIVQCVDHAVYDQLNSGDILFIDSTHIVKTGSDVVHLVQNVLPRIKPGVLIHFHDIFDRFEYPAEWVIDENRSWNEAHYLLAFLTNNQHYEVVFFTNYFSKKYKSMLREAFPGYQESQGGSLWLRKVS